MGIIYQTDKRSGLTYAYENKAYWDKEKKQSRAKRELIGRVDPETGEIVPTDGRNKKTKAKTAECENENCKKRYEKLLKKCAAQESVIAALRKRLAETGGQGEA
jgi:hypothetical protein